MKRVAISSAVLFVVTMALGFLVHGYLLHGDYHASGLMRPDAEFQGKLGFLVFAHALIAVGFTLIYRRGREARPWLGQGVRFGLLWAVGAVWPIYLIYHAIMPFELPLVLKQIVFDGAAVVVTGIVAAFVNKDSDPAIA